MHLIRVPKKGLALQLPISLCWWATHTLKSLKHPHQKQLHGRQFLLDHIVLVGQRGTKKRPLFSDCRRVCPESFALLRSAIGCPEHRQLHLRAMPDLNSSAPTFVTRLLIIIIKLVVNCQSGKFNDRSNKVGVVKITLCAPLLLHFARPLLKSCSRLWYRNALKALTLYIIMVIKGLKCIYFAAHITFA